MNPKWLAVLVLISLLAGSFLSNPMQAAQAAPAPGAPALAARFSALQAQARQDGQVRLIVQLDTGRAGLAPVSPQAAIQRAQSSLLSSLPGGEVKAASRYDNLPFLALTLTPAGLAALQNSPQVTAVQADHLNRPALAESGPLVGAPAAWTAGYDGSGQVVAILDTGVDKTHTFLAGKVVSEACYSGGGYPSGSLCPGGVTSSTAPGSAAPALSFSAGYHGTHVAGIAAGAGSSFSGIARGAQIIAMQIFSDYYGDLAAYDSDIIHGLDRVYALRNTYSIASVNLSLGGDPVTAPCDADNTATKAAIDTLGSAGIAVVVASGNEFATNGISSPACISTAISVGSTSKTDAISPFSNTASFLSIYAPGGSIYSSVPGGGYANHGGTSMATPHVAGAWAVIKQKAPQATVAEVLAALRSTGPVITGRGYSIPRLQLDAALDTFLLPLTAPSDLAAVLNGTAVDLTWTDHSNDEDGFEIQRASSGSAWSVVGSVGAGVTAFTDASARCGRHYDYRVQAVSSQGGSPFSNTAGADSAACGLPAAPANLAAAAQSRTEIRLTWDDNATDEDNFLLEASFDGGATWSTLVEPAANATEALHANLHCGTRVDYRLAAVNPAGASAAATASAETLACAAYEAPQGATLERDGVTYAFRPDCSGISDCTATRQPLQAAVDFAQSGETISIGTGDYFEQVRIVDKDLTLLGQPAERYRPRLRPADALAVESGIPALAIRLPEAASAQVQPQTQGSTPGGAAAAGLSGRTSLPEGLDPSQNPTPLLFVSGGQVTIRDLAFDGGDRASIGIFLLNAGAELAGNRIEGAGFGLAAVNTISGTLQTLTLDDNRITGAGLAGVSLLGFNGPIRATLSHNLIDGRALGTFGLVAASKLHSETALVTAEIVTNTVQDNTLDGVMFYYPRGMGRNTWSHRFQNNLLAGNGYEYASYYAATVWNVVGQLAGNWWQDGQSAAAFLESCWTYDPACLNDGNTYGLEGFYDDLSAPPDGAPSAAVTDLGVEPLSYRSLRLSWTDRSDSESEYLVERSGDGESGWAAVAHLAADTVTYDDAGLLCGTPYFYRVVPVNSSGEWEPSNIASAPTGACTLPLPGTPTGFTGLKVSESQFDLSWTDASSSEAGFRIERSHDGQTNWAEIATAAAGATGYSDSSLACGQDYAYRVQAFTAGSDSAYTPVVATRTLPCDPDPLTASSLIGGVQLAWTDRNQNETGYRVERTPAGSEDWSELAVLPPGSRSYQDTGLACETAYTYRVRAANDEGFGPYSQAAAGASEICPPGAPTDLHGGPVASPLGVQLTFSDGSTTETGFVIEQAPQGESEFTLALPITSTFEAGETLPWFNVTGLTCSQETQFRVRATNAGGYSEPSNIVSLVVDCPPPAPNGVQVQAVVSDTLQLSWSRTAETQRTFLVERARDGASTWTAYAPQAETAFEQGGLTCGGIFNYRVKARNNVEQVSAAAPTVRAVVKCDLGGPVNLAAAYAPDGVRLTWEDASLLDVALRVERSLEGSTTWTQLADLPATDTEFIDTSRVCGQTYVYRVGAVSSSSLTAYSDGLTFSACPATPTPTPTATQRPTATPTPTATARPTTPPVTATPLYPVLTGVFPAVVRENATAALRLTGANFTPYSLVQVGSRTWANPAFRSSTELQVMLWAGEQWASQLPAGGYDVTVCNPGAGCATLPKGLMVVNSDPVVARIYPSQGYTDLAGAIQVVGYNFQTGMEARLGSYSLEAEVNGPYRATLYYPAGAIPAGEYPLLVRNPQDEAWSTAPETFRLVDPQADAVRLNPENIWTQPATLRQGSAANLNASLRRTGSRGATLDLAVAFYEGDPDAGGLQIGTAHLILPAAVGSVGRASVPYTPSEGVNPAEIHVVVTGTAAGNVLARAERDFPILAAEPDSAAPSITRLEVNRAAWDESRPEVPLTLEAADDQEVRWLWVAAYQFDAGSRQWLAVGEPAWQPFHANPTVQLAWGGMARVVAWVADPAGNVSSMASTGVFNYLPQEEPLRQGEVQIYRFRLTAGQPVRFSLSTLSGDADLYVWGPGSQRWWSVDPGTELDEVAITPNQSGVYQVEVVGYEASVYTLAFAAGTSAPVAFEPAAVGSKLRSAPVIAPELDDLAGSQPPVVPVELYTTRVFLPFLGIKE